MAVVLAYRAAIALTPILVRMVQTSSADLPARQWLIAQGLWKRLTDPDESDEDLSIALSDASGYNYTVATFTGAFELRKLQIEFRLSTGGADVDDQRVMTFHFLKLAGGSPSADWVAGDFTAIETAFGTLWAALKVQQVPNIRLSQYRWYKAGPDVAPPQEPVRVVDQNVPGTSTAVQAFPPQVAATITERTGSRRAWGRSYFPVSAPFGGSVGSHTDLTGRFTSGYLTALANAFDTFYEAALTAGVPIVVYSPAKPERPKKPSGTLAATVARALTVDTIQVDDIPDVIRSRRFNKTLLRVQRGVGA
ncbi:MAG TPA: hypothetical protein VM756_01155 [Burkholderiales bacterium]|nr:hypothetical protein [Burkholderiales bacterium]